MICPKLSKVMQMKADDKRSSSAIVGPVFQRPTYYTPRTLKQNGNGLAIRTKDYSEIGNTVMDKRSHLNSTATTQVWPIKPKRPRLAPLHQEGAPIHFDQFAVNGILDSAS